MNKPEASGTEQEASCPDAVAQAQENDKLLAVALVYGLC